MSPLAILRSASVDAARLLRRAESIGRLAPSLEADLIGVAGDPLEDATSLERVRFVMADGVVRRHDLAGGAPAR